MITRFLWLSFLQAVILEAKCTQIMLLKFIHPAARDFDLFRGSTTLFLAVQITAKIDPPPKRSVHNRAPQLTGSFINPLKKLSFQNASQTSFHRVYPELSNSPLVKTSHYIFPGCVFKCGSYLHVFAKNT